MLQRHYTSLRMVDAQYNLNEQPNEGGLFFWFFNSIFLGNLATGFECYILLKKDGKTICRTRCLNPLIQMPLVWTISNIVRQKPDVIVSGLPQCVLLPAFQNSQQQNEWGLFLGFLQKYKRVKFCTCYLIFILFMFRRILRPFQIA